MISRPLFLILMIAGSVHSTPPHVMTADLVMLGGSDSVAVFLVSTGFNHGSHYLWETRWFLLAMDLLDLSFEWEPLGSMMHASEEFGGNRFDTEDCAPSIPAALQEWGVDRPFGFQGLPLFSPCGGTFDYRIRDSLLLACHEAFEQPLPGARCFDPGYLAVVDTELQEYFSPGRDSIVRQVTRLGNLPRFFDGTEGVVELQVVAEVSLDTLHLMVMRVISDAAPFDVIFTVPEAELEAAGDSLFPAE